MRAATDLCGPGDRVPTTTFRHRQAILATLSLSVFLIVVDSTL